MKRFRPRHSLIVVLFGLSSLAAITGRKSLTEIFLPGTQPGVVDPLASPDNCSFCHQGQGAGLVTIVNDWKGSMMANAARDPVFYSAVAIANKYRPGSGELCIRCHSPGGWLEGRSEPPTGEALTGNDLFGVQCDVCHRLKDSVLPDTTAIPPVPGYGNGMMIVQVPTVPKRGPYSDPPPTHPTLYDSLQVSSNLCGTCHNVSNPFYADDPVTQSPHEYSPIERTYSEWLLSDYSSMGTEGTCQFCHMPPEPGYGAIVEGTPWRPDIPQHHLNGGNTFVPDILYDFWGSDVDTALLREGKERAAGTLRSAADIEVTAGPAGDSVFARVRVTNLTGHKLPTGYPEGRRMWLNLVARNAAGDTLFESGRYDPATGELTIDPQAKIYELKPGLTRSTAAEFGLEAGPSFHFILNDSIFFDNRIPPRGFTNASFESHKAQPVGYHYADGQYWDITTYALPSGVTSVSASLYYQTASKEYITFLRDENVGNIYDWNEWGQRLYDAWDTNGKSKPVLIDSATVRVGPGGTPAVTCSEVQQFTARCLSGGERVQAKIVVSPAGPGDSVTIAIDSVPYRIPINTRPSGRIGRAVLTVPSSGSGPHTAVLVDPSGCLDTVFVECKNDQAGPDDEWTDSPDVMQNLAGSELPKNTSLRQNYPNPFNPSTTISFDIHDEGWVSIEVYSSLGQKVATVVNGYYRAGSYSTVWNGTDDSGTTVSGGVYICRIRTNGYTESRKMLFLK